jgi:hypothetical protein
MGTNYKDEKGLAGLWETLFSMYRSWLSSSIIYPYLPFITQLLILEITLKILPKCLWQFQTPTSIGKDIVPYDKFHGFKEYLQDVFDHCTGICECVTPPRIELQGRREKYSSHLWNEVQIDQEVSEEGNSTIFTSYNHCLCFMLVFKQSMFGTWYLKFGILSYDINFHCSNSWIW